jgi:hypothetical protein
MAALGWKVKAKTTKKEMVDHLGKTSGAWRFRAQQVQQAKQEKARRDKVSVNIHSESNDTS